MDLTKLTGRHGARMFFGNSVEMVKFFFLICYKSFSIYEKYQKR